MATVGDWRNYHPDDSGPFVVSYIVDRLYYNSPYGALTRVWNQSRAFQTPDEALDYALSICHEEDLVDINRHLDKWSAFSKATQAEILREKWVVTARYMTGDPAYFDRNGNYRPIHMLDGTTRPMPWWLIEPFRKRFGEPEWLTT